MESRSVTFRLTASGIERADPAHFDAAVALHLPNEDYVETIVSGWPWNAPAPALLPSEERAFWVRRGGHGADLVGITSSRAAIAAEAKNHPFERGIDRPIRQLVRGLARAWRIDSPTKEFLASPFGEVDRSRDGVAVLVFNASYATTFDDSAAKFGRRFADVLAEPADVNWKEGEKKALSWLEEQPRSVRLMALAFERRVRDGLLLRVTSWDFGRVGPATTT